MPVRSLAVSLALASALVLAAAGTAGATAVTCNVAASGGFANCLVQTAPTIEQAKAPNASALDYRFQLHRYSDGANWGWWQWSDLDYHTVLLAPTGAITAQVDNLGSGTQGYYVMMQ